MLNFFLGWTVGLGSLGFYLAGYLLPEVRRKKDAIWSGVGLIYALALLTNGDRISGGLFVGQLASATLIGWFGWQTLQQRRELSDATSQTPIPHSIQSVFPFLKQGWERLRTTYTDSEDEDGDLLASGFKKASALLAGRSDSAESFNATSTRSKPEAAPIHTEEKEDWGDDQPSESSSRTIPANPLPETSPPVAESVEHLERSEAIAKDPHPEPVPPEEPPTASTDNAVPTETSEVTPSIVEEIKVVDEVVSTQPQTISEEQISASVQEPDSQPDLSQPSSTSASPTGEEENWPPQELDDASHHES
jgi:Ycf66 protein N-terminus